MIGIVIMQLYFMAIPTLLFEIFLRSLLLTLSSIIIISIIIQKIINLQSLLWHLE